MRNEIIIGGKRKRVHVKPPEGINSPRWKANVAAIETINFLKRGPLARIPKDNPFGKAAWKRVIDWLETELEGRFHATFKEPNRRRTTQD